jgi:hypothetical protein
MNIGYITIADNAGNTTDCPVRVHLDWTSPSVTVNAYKRNADGSVGTFIVSVRADKDNPTVTLNNYEKYGYGGNSWLNAANFPHGIVYEVVTGDNVILNEGTWYENARGLWLPNSEIDTLPKKSTKAFTSTDNKARYPITDEGFRKARFVLTDKALNFVTVNITSPMDRTLPTASASKSNLDTEAGVTVTVACSDSGSKCQQNPYVYRGVTSSQRYYVYDNAGNQNSNDVYIPVSRYACHPYQYACGSYACGSYSCNCRYRYACCTDDVWGGGYTYVCSTCTSYCTAYCTGWKTCYR